MAVAGLVLAAAFTASPAAARPAATTSAAKPSCYEVPYSDRLQAPHNAAGVIFVRHGDYWRLWDNQRDNWIVRVEYNYAGVNDRWKAAAAVDDGGYAVRQHNVREKYKYLCFRLYSPRFGYTGAVRYRT